MVNFVKESELIIYVNFVEENIWFEIGMLVDLLRENIFFFEWF